jgi:hypothetical protein
MTSMMRTNRENTGLRLAFPEVSTHWFDEPPLTFAKGKEHTDPKVGIPLYGPASLGSSRHKNEVHVGFIGTGEGIEKATQFYAACCEGIDGDEQHQPFPGCKIDRGFRCVLRMDGAFNEKSPRVNCHK